MPSLGQFVHVEYCVNLKKSADENTQFLPRMGIQTLADENVIVYD